MILLREYLTVDPRVALERLAEIAQELMGRVQEVGMVEAQRHQARLEGFRRSQEPTVAGREREADFNALAATMSLFELKAEVEGLREEQAFLTLVVQRAQ